MQVTRFDETAVFELHGSDFRSGDIVFHDLLTGEEGAPDNYGLQMVDVIGNFAAPRHRHNFEQIRVILDGSFGYDDGKVQQTGSIGYFCEGTRYTQNAQGNSRTLLLQVGGPSRAGFMSRRQLVAGMKVLREHGSFKDGVYTWHDANGKKHNQDSYEAVWEHVMDRVVRYPEPQFDGPVLFWPDRFAYVAVPGQQGVARRDMGCFNERGLAISMLRVDAGAVARFDADAHVRLMHCIRGAGNAERLQGEAAVHTGRWEPLASIRVDRGERARLAASEDSEFYLFTVPAFS